MRSKVRDHSMMRSILLHHVSLHERLRGVELMSSRVPGGGGVFYTSCEQIPHNT